MSVEAVKAGVLVLLAVGGWAWGRLPEHLVALAFFTAAVLFSVAPPSVVFSGFTSSALWLIFGGQVMGVAIRHTGLDARIADTAARWLGVRSYPRVIAGLVVIGTVLAFFMPSSMGRTVLLMPIAGTLADRYGFEGSSPGRTGILLATAYGTYMPGLAILPANVPNAVLIGAAETRYGIVLGWVEYFVLHFPVLGLLRAGLLVGLVLVLYPARLARRPAAAPARTPLSGPERAVATLLSVALVLWATDGFHHISAAWISLAVALIMLWPRAGLVPPRAINQEINYASLLFIAGILGVGAVMAHAGLGDVLGRMATAALPLTPGAPARNFAALCAMGTLLGLVTTSPGLPAVMTPLAASLASASGLPLRSVLMTEVIGFSTNLLPYQSPPVVVAKQLSTLTYRDTAIMTLALAAGTTLLLLPIDYAWWRALGWLG